MEQKRKFIIYAIIGGVFLLLSACKEPVPLYGTWSDNVGDTIQFFEDGGFNVSIYIYNSTETFEGNYTVLMNSLVFDCTNKNLKVVTEWDIRGNMLYLDWTMPDKTTTKLTLFKIAN